jgi:hypothetical protein
MNPGACGGLLPDPENNECITVACMPGGECVVEPHHDWCVPTAAHAMELECELENVVGICGEDGKCVFSCPA